jgi:hypothetical protein
MQSLEGFNPDNYVPVLMVPRKTMGTFKKEPKPHPEENIVSPPLPLLKIRPSQELLAPGIKNEPIDIVDIDD